MKNKEKYAKEIVDMAIAGHHFGFDKCLKKIIICNARSCGSCLFRVDTPCSPVRKEWANAEYKEKKEFSEVDKALVKDLNKLNWFAVDKDGDVWGFVKRPVKEGNYWYTDDGLLLRICRFSSATFEPLSWEDEEPTHRSEILGE